MMSKEELYDKCENMEQLYDKYYSPLLNNWHELKKFIDERIKSVQEEKEEFEEDLYNNYETNCAEIIIRRCELTQLEDIRERMQELENK